MSAYLDLAARISARPWQAVAAAFALGAWLALEQPRPARTAIGRSVLASVGGITLGLVRELATQRALGAARSWLDELRVVHAA